MDGCVDVVGNNGYIVLATVTSIQRRDNKKYLPRTVKVTKTLGGKTAYSITDYRIYNINNTYFTYGYNTIDVDYDENTTIILTDYDEEKGCLLEHTVESDWDDMEMISLEVCRLASSLNKRVREFAIIDAKGEWDD